MKSSLPSSEKQFAKAKLGEFFQDKPQLHNPYTTDGPFKRYLKRLLPAEVILCKLISKEKCY